MDDYWRQVPDGLSSMVSHWMDTWVMMPVIIVVYFDWASLTTSDVWSKGSDKCVLTSFVNIYFFISLFQTSLWLPARQCFWDLSRVLVSLSAGVIIILVFHGSNLFLKDIWSWSERWLFLVWFLGRFPFMVDNFSPNAGVCTSRKLYFGRLVLELLQWC